MATATHPDTVKALRWHEIDDLRLDRIPVPEPKADEVLVHNLYTGICATDRHALHHGTFIDRDSGLNYPAILGHEGASEIIALGEGVEFDGAGQPIKPGDIVCYQDILGCGQCRFCQQGSVNVCVNARFAGQKPGHFVQYYSYPRQLLIRVDGITPKQASLVEPASVAMHGARRSGIQVGDTALILGAGPVALFRLQHLKSMGAARVIIAEIGEKRRKLAKELGADVVIDPNADNVLEVVRDLTNGYGADVAFEDVGVPQLQLLAIDAVRPHGTVVITGITTSPVTLNFVDRVMLYELAVIGSNGYSLWWDRPHDFTVVAALMRTGRLKTDPMISHVFSMEDYKEAFRMAGDSANAIKVTFDLS
jgi:(R,R)-butanediol dehydrogenase/meso-butanediol dehydrogenase/diacetyl reductase